MLALVLVLIFPFVLSERVNFSGDDFFVYKNHSVADSVLSEGIGIFSHDSFCVAKKEGRKIYFSCLMYEGEEIKVGDWVVLANKIDRKGINLSINGESGYFDLGEYVLTLDYDVLVSDINYGVWRYGIVDFYFGLNDMIIDRSEEEVLKIEGDWRSRFWSYSWMIGIDKLIWNRFLFG